MRSRSVSRKQHCKRWMWVLETENAKLGQLKDLKAKGLLSLMERELPRIVELVRGRERIPLHSAFPTSRWRMDETTNGKRYLVVGGLGS